MLPEDYAYLSGVIPREIDNRLIIHRGTTVPAEPIPPVVDANALHQNFPNPFNASTSISFELASTGHVNLGVFDLLGREAASLVNNSLSTGSHAVVFDAANLPSGLYFYRIEAADFHAVKKMILIK